MCVCVGAWDLVFVASPGEDDFGPWPGGGAGVEDLVLGDVPVGFGRGGPPVLHRDGPVQGQGPAVVGDEHTRVLGNTGRWKYTPNYIELLCPNDKGVILFG